MTTKEKSKSKGFKTSHSMMLNGILTKKEFKETNNKGFLNFDLVDNRNWKDKNGTWHQDAEFFHCCLIGERAKYREESLHLGDLVSIVAKRNTSTYKNADGDTKYFIKWVVSDLKVLGSKIPNVEISKEDLPNEPENDLPF